MIEFLPLQYRHSDPLRLTICVFINWKVIVAAEIPSDWDFDRTVTRTLNHMNCEIN